MLKRHGCSSVKFTLKRHRCSRVEKLPHDVVELILERISVASLVKFKSVCKQWKSTIESRRFQERQLIRRRQSRGEDVLFVSIIGNEAGRRRIVLGSSVISTVSFPIPSTYICHGSCDGLLCLGHPSDPSFVINPATGWHQSFPNSSFEQLVFDIIVKGIINQNLDDFPSAKLGFGKDKLRGTYKPVWLYNSSEVGLDNVTTCEVFDFGTNAWRYLDPASPYEIITCHYPVYLDGSLHWFTQCQDTKVISLDLHTETFQVISKTPFPHVRDPPDVFMSILDNRLCVSERNWPTQDIWSLDSSGTWEKICSIDLTKTFTFFGDLYWALQPVAILDKNKLLLYGNRNFHPVPLVIHDLHTKSYDLLYMPTTVGNCVSYFQSLFTLPSN